MLIIHDLNLAAAFADEIVLMAGGRIAGKGKPDDLLNEDLLSHTFGCRLRVVFSEDGGRLIFPSAITRKVIMGAAAE